MLLVLSLVAASLAGSGAPLASATGGHLHVSPGNLEFPSVVVGRSSTLTFEIKNTGSTKLCVYHLYLSKVQFTLSGPSTPVSIFPSKTVQFKVTFRPSTTGKISGLLEIVSSAQALVTYTMTGSGEAPVAQLQLSPTSLNFGSVDLRSTNTKTVTAKNTGDVPLKIAGVTSLGSGFTFSNLSAGVALAPNQQHTFQVSFRPQAKGTASGKISIMCANLSSMTTLPLAGNAVAPPSPPPPSLPPQPPQPTQPSPAPPTTPPAAPPPANPVSFLPPPSSIPATGQLTIHLGWAPSPSPVIGYRVHRGESKGGPYPNYTSDPLPLLDYIDTSVNASATYYYVVTSIDSTGAESEYSNEVSASLSAIPAPTPDPAPSIPSPPTSASSSPSSSPVSPPPQQTSAAPAPPVPPPVIHLSWAPSESAVIGYRVYRSLIQDGPYTNYNPGPLDALSFDDIAVVSGSAYFYVVTALDSEGNESVYSNEVAVSLPPR